MAPYACAIVWDNECEDQTNMRCFACGRPACKECTTVLPVWYFWRNKRVCKDCQEEEKKSPPIATVTPEPKASSAHLPMTANGDTVGGSSGMTRQEAIAYLQSEAAKRGKTFQEFLDTDLRAILEKAWEIQQRDGAPVSIDKLYLELTADQEARSP